MSDYPQNLGSRLIISTFISLALAAQLRLYAYHQAEFHHLRNPDAFVATLECESGFTSDIIGDHGTSFGVAQFHNPDTDWGFTKESALDPWFAIAKAAEAFEKGQASRWSCYRMVLAKSYTHASFD